MSTLSERIAGLSPAKQKLFELRQQRSVASVKRYPLSYGQKRLWFLDQLQPGNPAYNVARAVHLNGALNVTALQAALTELVRRHEVLRTRFRFVEGIPFQEVVPSYEQTLELIDISHLEPEQQAESCRQIVNAEAERRFDLAENRLFITKIVRLNPEDHLLALNTHHIVSDGWSTALLVRELSALYSAFLRGEKSPLSELSMQYGDFALWQEKWLQSSWFQAQTDYWRQELTDDDQHIELPLDRPRTSNSTWRGAARRFTLDAAISRELRCLSRSSDTTLFMVLLTAFSALLFRYSGQSTINVGTPIAGRNRIELEDLIGFFSNTLVIRSSSAPGLTVAGLLQQIRCKVLEAHTNQDVPFEMLVELLRPERDLANNPLFNVIFVFQNLPPAEIKLPNLIARTFPLEKTATKFDLTLTLSEQGTVINGVFEYREGLLAAATIEHMVGHFHNLLNAMITGPDQKISELPLLTAKEQQQIIEDWNATGVTYKRAPRIHQLFEQQVERTPDAVALEFEGQQINYRELNRRANQLARRLLEHGVGPEVRVGLFMDRETEMIVAVLGVMKAGGAYVPLDPLYPVKRLRYITENASLAVLLTQNGTQEIARTLSRAAVIVVDREWNNLEGLSGKNERPRSEPENLAYVLYTSGSTGQPKGVCIEHRQLTNYVEAITERLGKRPCSFAMVQPLSVDASITALFPPLLTGGCVYIISREWSLDAACMNRFFAEHKVEGLKIAPSHLAALHRAAGEKRRELMPTELLVLGGEASAWNWIKELQEMAPGCAVFNQYGPTETTVAVLAYRYGEEDPEREYGSTPLGRPLGNTHAYVLDTNMQAMPVGVMGEIYIGGANVGRGYLRQPAMTADRFVPNPFSRAEGDRLYRTGDYGKWTGDGRIEFLGRGDDQIKIRGYRVECSEIQLVLTQHPEITEAFVLAWEDGNERKLAAYVVPRETTKPLISDLRDYLHKHFPEYMVPSVFVFLEALPLTQHGKIDRHALPLAASNRCEATAEYVAPVTEIQYRLAGIFSELLGIKTVGIHDNFFELGGHSLLATQVIARLRSELNQEMPLRALFEEPTIARLEKRIEQQRSNGESARLPALVKIAGGGPRPLSYAQLRLWFLHQFDPLNVAYNVPHRLRIRGNLDKEALQVSFNEIARRHEALRTRFVRVSEAPMQVIVPDLRLPIEKIDLRGCKDQEREQEATRWATEEAEAPFDLQNPPLMRIKLLQMGDEDHVLIVNVHHIVYDGWSLGIMVREIAALYGAYANGKAPNLKELPVQYGDYAVCQRELLQGEVFKEQVHYWRQELAGASVLELPKEQVGTGMPSDAGAVLEWEFGNELSGQLRQLSQREGATLFMTLLGSFQVLLSRYSGQNDISVATPVAGRRWSEAENLIGFFVNTLVLRTNIARSAGFRSVLKEVRETALRAYANQDLPFEKLVEELRPERDLEGMPLFKVMFILQNMQHTPVQMPGLRITSEKASSGKQKFAITLAAVDEQKKISIALGYRSGLFSEAMMNRLLGHWENLLQNIIANQDTRVDELSILSLAERKQILEEWNLTEAKFPQRAIHEQFEQQARKTPGATAVEYEGELWNYDELNRRANQLGRYLKKLGVGPESLVGICMERSVEMVISLLAVLKSGAAYIPLDPDYPAERLAYMFQHARAEVLLVKEIFQDRWSSVASAVALDGEWEKIAKESENNLNVNLNMDNPAYVIYTSGSTGRPKGVMVTHAALNNHMQWMQDAFPMDARDRVLQKTAFSFDASVWEFYAPLITGGCLVLARPGGQRDRDYLLQCLTEKRITVVQFVPSQLQMLVETESLEQCHYLRRAFCGGEALSMTLVKRLYDRAPWVKLCNLYGPTEATIDSVFEECKVEEDRTTALIGKPVAKMRAYVLSEGMVPLPVSIWGELYLGGVGLARGYVNEPELTAERFVPDPFSHTGGDRLYRTGDVVRWRAEGKLEFSGRRDHQVKLRGFRIELREIEAVLNQHEAVAESVVIVKGEAEDQRLLAYVLVRKEIGNAEFRESEVRHYLQTRLPGYMVPAAVVALEKWPLTPNGKINRSSFPEPEWTGAEVEEACRPQTIEAELLCGLWREVLKTRSVGVHDNFFKLGGHSLLATQVVSRIKRVFGLELHLRVLFEAPTVAELAEYIVQQQRTRSGWSIPALVRTERRNSSPLSYAQQRLWFLDQLKPGDIAYNMPLRLRLKGSLSPQALQASFDEVVRRHEMLRTRFVMDEEGPVQMIAAELQWQINCVDMRAWNKVVKESETTKLSQQEATTPFNLSQGPLIRARLLQLEEEEHVLLINLHHIISDGWSMGILVQEIASLYKGHVEGEPPNLKELPVQYADYAIWQREWLQGAILAEQIGYWRKKLEGSALLDLPRERRLDSANGAGASKSWMFTAELSREVRDFSYREGVTLFMTLLASFQVLLSRYSGQSDISIGTPIAGRTQTELEGLIGFFANTLVLRTELGKNPEFKEVLRRVRETTLEAYAHQDVPFEKVVEELQPERDLVRTPLFQVMFIWQNVPRKHLELQGLKLSQEKVSSETEKFEMTLAAAEDEGRIHGELSYRQGLYADTTVEKLLAHWENLLNQIISSPERRIDEIPLLSSAERRQVLEEWNQTEQQLDHPTCVHELFAAQAAKTPEAVAVEHEDERLTYRELDRRSNQLAHYLRSLGAAPEVLIGICVERNVEMLVGLLGILKSGAAYLPLDFEHPANRLQHMLDDARAPILVMQSRLEQQLPRCQSQVVCLDSDWQRIAKYSEEPPDAITCAANPAYVIYTSGSTGKPKGVMVQHEGLVNILLSTIEKLGMNESDCLLATTTISFDIANLELFAPLLSGGRVVLSPPTKTGMQQVVLRARQGDITMMQATPSLWNAIIEELAGTVDNKVKILSGGEALDRATALRLLRMSPVVWNMYGPTETTVWSAMHPVEEEEADIVPIGKPIRRTQIYIVNEQMEPAPVGATGELYIAGAGLARGYLGRSELTAERFTPNPFSAKPGTRLYRTGDLARYLPEGTIEFVGRADHQVKLRGFRIEPSEIEVLLNAHEAVEQSIVMLQAGQSSGDSRLVGYVVRKANQNQELPSQSSQITRWQEVWQELYGTDDEQITADDFNLAGWRSSYTGEPIATEEMKIWVNETVDRLRAFYAARVLEIGCGTGLLLTRLAPDCEAYIGIDLSQNVLAQLSSYIRNREDLAHVELRQGAAHELSFAADDSVDLVVLNSVVQYFPSVDYLLQVLAEAVRIVRPEGHIFIGDVRNLALLEAYHASVQMHRAPAEMTLETLRQQTRQAILAEEELVVEPALFTELAARWEKPGQATLSPKVGAYDNELSRFRYDMTLKIGEKETISGTNAWLAWDETGQWQLDLGKILRQQAGATVGVRGIRDGRTACAVQISHLLHANDNISNVAELRSLCEQGRGQDQDELVHLARQLGATLSWGAVNSAGLYDVIFNPRWKRGSSADDVPARYYKRFGNEPAYADEAALARELQNYLKHWLPDYMVPSALMVLPSWPLTANGKVDRRALPIPGRSSKWRYRAPQTSLEETLCDIFATVLKCERVGVDDDFFEVGGHSLLAVRLLAQIEQRTKRKLPLAAIFQHSSVARLAQLLSDRKTSFRSTVVEIQTGTSKSPLFFVPGAGGSAFDFRHLVQNLHRDDSFLVFQDPGFDSPEAGESSIEAMAAEYIEGMRMKQRVGPYLLGGWSMGGLIALEMARQLHAQNQTVAMLALVDSYPPPTNASKSEDATLLFKSFLLNTGFVLQHLRQIRERSQTLEQGLTHALQIGIEAGVLPHDMVPETLERLFGIYRRHVIASRNFKLQSADVTTYLWRAVENLGPGDGPETLWKPYVRTLYVRDLPGNHFSILRPPHVAMLASQLSERIHDANAKILQSENRVSAVSG